MDPIVEIKKRLTPDQISRAEVTDTGITIESRDKSGFPVSIEAYDKEIVVFYDGWHEHFSDVQEAVNCFLLGLTPQCRLRVTEYGSNPYKWTMEWMSDREWEGDSTTGLVFVPFWRRKSISYKCNR